MDDTKEVRQKRDQPPAKAKPGIHQPTNAEMKERFRIEATPEELAKVLFKKK